MPEASFLFSQYGRVVDLMPEIVLILDDDYRILDANKTAVDELGVVVRPAHPKYISDILPDDERNNFRSVLPFTDQRIIETRFRKRDGSIINVKGGVRSLHSGQTKYWVLIMRDVTEENRKELDLLRFSNVIHNTINPIQISDAHGTMVYVNPAFEKVTGYTTEELIGKNPNILSSRKHDKEFWSGVWKQIVSGKVWVGKIENRRRDGSPFFTELVISPIVDAHGRIAGFLGAHRDITEQIILEQQLVRSQRMESIGTLAAGIAHEVGNPLTAISSLVQVIQRTSTDEFAKEKLELINSQVNRITRIIRELVDFSRPSARVVKPTNINRIVRDALNIVQYGKKVKDITFTLELDEQLPEIAAVPDQIVQVFINILMNAVDSLDERRGTITVRSRRNEQSVEVIVHDTGKGIEPSALEKIFEPFYTTKTSGHGTGLGLWVSYGIVKSFGGEVSVESIPEQGSTFTVSFPWKGL
ncbi:MAG: PAS domain-containing sensor histidine kinase [Ignavibacteriae bacterium]|nr:MAG: PAS domain-containing sensor histidine kinase [Ignavibacteriota bacterium]